jgi:hypothetical protein
MEEWKFILERWFNFRNWYHELKDLSQAFNLDTQPDFRRDRSKGSDRKDIEAHIREYLRDLVWNLLYRR